MTKQSTVTQGWISPAQAAEYTDLGVEFIREKLRAGEIRGSKVGSVWKVKVSELDEFMERHSAGGWA